MMIINQNMKRMIMIIEIFIDLGKIYIFFIFVMHFNKKMIHGMVRIITILWYQLERKQSI